MARFHIEEVFIIEVNEVAHTFKCKGADSGRTLPGLLLSSSPTEGNMGSKEFSLPTKGQHCIAARSAVAPLYIVFGFFNSMFPMATGDYTGAVSKPSILAGDKIFQFKETLVHFSNRFVQFNVGSWAKLVLRRLGDILEGFIGNINIHTYGGKFLWRKVPSKSNSRAGEYDTELMWEIDQKQDSVFDPSATPLDLTLSDTDKLFVRAGRTEADHLFELATEQSLLKTYIKDCFAKLKFGKERENDEAGTWLSLTFEDPIATYGERYGPKTSGELYEKTIERADTTFSKEETLHSTDGEHQKITVGSNSVEVNTGKADVPFEIKVNDTVFVFTVTVDGNLELNTNEKGKLVIDPDGNITQTGGGTGAFVTNKGILTPDTIFGGTSKVDTFTGMPFVGCKSVGAEDG